MPLITVDKLTTVQTSIDKLTEQGRLLFADIAETTQDRARLLKNAEADGHAIAEAQQQIARLQGRVDELETMLDNVRATIEIARPTVGNVEPLRRKPDAQGMLPRVDSQLADSKSR